MLLKEISHPRLLEDLLWTRQVLDVVAVPVSVERKDDLGLDIGSCGCSPRLGMTEIGL